MTVRKLVSKVSKMAKASAFGLTGGPLILLLLGRPSRARSIGMKRTTNFQMWNNNSWNFDTLSIQIPQDIKHNIISVFFTNHKIQKDTPLWRLNGDGLFF